MQAVFQEEYDKFLNAPPLQHPLPILFTIVSNTRKSSGTDRIWGIQCNYE
jgi:hypothetical protein